MPRFLLICIALGLSSAAAHAQTASEVLAKVATVYANSRTYSDEGRIKVEFAKLRGTHSSFRTRFVRGAGFRYQLWFNSDKPDRGVSWGVWKNGEAIRVDGVQGGIGVQNLPLDTALSRMAGPTAGGSLTVPQLLLPNDFRVLGLLDLIANPKITGEEKVDGRPTFRIEGTLLGQPLKLWIDKSQYLILKSYRKIIVAEQDEESTIQYKPRLNVEIPPEDLTLPPSRDQIVGKPESPAQLSSSPPVLAPRLRKFGSSLTSDSNKAAGRAAERTADDEDVVRVETDLVVSNVLVLDAEGKIVRGLNREDFIVKEDDKVQEVASLSLGDNKDLPRSIVLIIDYSGSQLPYLKTSIESAKMLVDKLNPKDRMAVVTDDVKLLVDFTSDKQLLKAQLEKLKSNAFSGDIGASEQYDALMATLSELFDNEDTRPIIIFQTDGDELEALKGGPGLEPHAFPRKYSLEDVLTATEKARATIYSVISGLKFIGVPEGEVLQRARVDWEIRQNATLDLIRASNLRFPKNAFTVGPVQPPPDPFLIDHGKRWLRRQTALANLAKFTGTIPEFLEAPDQADEIYTRVLTDIDRRYVLGYYPTNRLRDGKRRKVSIEVRNHPEYIVWGQKAYFARKEQ